ncbi:uncharacterized protein LOC126673807 [Mercurialis annua]|uniref:uncharacterized protein LOC126673807 n=1 Tax=Mercurialis annua TaxID=3986 RepID=UPI00215E7573|nr:uncharacterized protein LOC126673807 [Mercurialis annua]
MEEHQTRKRDDLRIEITSPPISHRKTLSSSSSGSSASSLGSPFELDVTKNMRLSPGNDDSSETPLSNGYETAGTETRSSSNNNSPMQSPPKMMTMEPPPPVADSNYRIPSSVFARNKSSAPAEWSTTSNESLFSIHMGNTSFTRDHVNWFGKSGELGLLGDPAMSPMMDFSTNQYLNHPPRPPELGQPGIGNVEAHFGVTESKAAETMREVIKENEADHAHKEKTLAKKNIRSGSFRGSDASGASVTSFAFPILTGDHKTDASPRKQHGMSHQNSQPQTPKVSNDQPKLQAIESGKPTETNPNQRRWYNCFPCCSSCSS